LYVDDPLGRELEFDHRHSSLFQVLEESHLRGLQEHQAAPLAIRPARCPSDAVDIVAGIIGRVELNDPVDRWNLRVSVEDVTERH
jgi:hypothetical protein